MNPYDRDAWNRDWQERHPFDYRDPDERRREAIRLDEDRQRQDQEYRRTHAGKTRQGLNPLQVLLTGCLMPALIVAGVIVLTIVFVTLCSLIGSIPIQH